jgi:hypothetical protein
MGRFFKDRKSTQQLLREFLMSAQTDVDTAVAAINTAAQNLTAAATQLSGLGIPAPVDTSALAPATTALATAVTAVQSAVSAEAAKLAPPAA